MALTAPVVTGLIVAIVEPLEPTVERGSRPAS